MKRVRRITLRTPTRTISITCEVTSRMDWSRSDFIHEASNVTNALVRALSLETAAPVWNVRVK